MYRIASYDSHTKPERQQRYARRRRCYGLHATDAGFREFSHVQLGKQPSLEVAPTTLATFFSYERKLRTSPSWCQDKRPSQITKVSRFKS